MRIWTFGCSFTQYFWPTWADMLIAEVNDIGHSGENWGCEGAGNLYIASKIWECNAKNKFGPNDWVLVCWSSMIREDRYINNRWETLGNVFSIDPNVYQSDPKHFAIRDSTLITSTQLALNNLNVNSLHWSILPFNTVSRGNADPAIKLMEDVLNIFNITLDLPPMMEYLNLLTNDPTLLKHRLTTFKHNDIVADWHPAPWEHEKYLKECILPRLTFLPNNLSLNTLNFINEWNMKVKNFKQPIDLKLINWKKDLKGW
jgi:hypothetical protein